MEPLSAFGGHRSTLYTGSIVCRHQPVMQMDTSISVRDRLLFSSHPSLTLVDSTRQPLTAASPSMSLSSAVSSMLPSSAPIQNAVQPSFLSIGHVQVTAGSVQPGRPPRFGTPTSSLATNRLQSFLTRSSVSDQVPVITRPSLSGEHSSYAIDRLREKIGRGWLPPEPPYPPPPDDVPASHGVSSAESGMTTFSPPERNKTLVSALPNANMARVHPEAELCVEPPMVDSTTEVTTTADSVDDNVNQYSGAVAYLPKRPTEREDGEISDDEPDSVGTDLPPDSSGISSSNSHWNQSGPPSFRGFRGGGVMMYRPRLPRFPYPGGRFPRGRGFFRGRVFAPWRQWYDHPSQHAARDWGTRDDEHIVDSSSVMSPQMETSRKQSTSLRSPVHSPISSSDSEQEESSRHSRSDHHRSSSSRRSRHKSKSKHDDHPMADSTRTSVVASPEFEPSSDSDKEPVSQASACKKKVGCFRHICKWQFLTCGHNIAIIQFKLCQMILDNVKLKHSSKQTTSKLVTNKIAANCSASSNIKPCIYTMSQKNVPCLFCCNFDTREWILIFFR